MDGRVIAFEGIDGSGKGVQIREIAGRLEALGRKVLVQDFPVYSGFFGKEIGRMLSGEKSVRADEVDARSMSLWYALDRYEALKGIDREEYDDILFNRSTLSNAVYQSIRTKEEDREDFLKWLFELEFERLGIWRPDLYFIFDVSEEQSKKNVEKKEKRTYLTETFDVYEKSQTIMNQARGVYLRLAGEHDNMFVISCMDENGTLKGVHEIASLVMDRLMEK